MLRLAILAALFGGLTYATVFVDLGGKSLVMHLAEIWQAPLVQQKVAKLKDGVKVEIENRLAKATDAAHKKAGERLVNDGITSEDRAALFEVIKKAGIKP